MSNEELVAAIQEGDMELMESLWERVRRLVHTFAYRYYMATQGRGGVTVEDLEQIGYLAMMDAIPRYNPGEAAFSTYLVQYLRKHFQEASGRLYLDKNGNLRSKDMLDYAVSLDMPMGDDPQSDTLADVVPDPDAIANIEQVEESVWRVQLRNAVSGVMQELEPEQAKVLYHRFWKNQTYNDAAGELGITDQNVRTGEARALRRLRHGRYTAKLRPFFDFNCYSGTGLQAFRSSGMSAQERYMIKQEEANRRLSTWE